MDSIIERIKQHPQPITLDSLEKFVNELDLSNLKLEGYIVPPEFDGDYGRRICCEEPFEFVVVHWPAGVSSGVHLHDGLIGCVRVLEGQLENVSYLETPGKLIESERGIYEVGEVMREEDGAIHRLCNHSSTNRAITLHFYYPALASFEGMRIYNLENGDIGILSEGAKSAVWSEDEGHFIRIYQGAFSLSTLSTS